MQTGTVIDSKYEIVRQLGSGGFGAVYEAHQLQLNRQVAIKMLNTVILQQPDGLARFEREAKALQALQHAHIVGFYAYGVWQGAPYMVMELVPGKSLQDILNREKSIEPRRALEIMRQVFQGLGVAHAAGVVHRDLKPSNVMVTQTDAKADLVKIIDFGLAKLMPGYGLSAQKLTETGMTLGSCHYMPPEQALGGVIDQRADIYSAGCILYQIVSGRLPFEAEDNVAIMFQHLNEQATPLDKMVALTPQYKPVATFVQNCMIKDADHRYKICADAIIDIDHILKNQGKKVTGLATDSKPSRKSWSTGINLWKVAVATILFAGSMGAYYFVQHCNEEKAALLLKREQLHRIARRFYAGDVGNYHQALKQWRSGAILRLPPDRQVPLLAEILSVSHLYDRDFKTVPKAYQLHDDELGQAAHNFISLIGARSDRGGDRTAGEHSIDRASALSDLYELNHPQLFHPDGRTKALMCMNIADYYVDQINWGTPGPPGAALTYLGILEKMCSEDPALWNVIDQKEMLRIFKDCGQKDRLDNYCRGLIQRESTLKQDDLSDQARAVIGRHCLENEKFDEARRIGTQLCASRLRDSRRNGTLLLAGVDTAEGKLDAAQTKYSELLNDGYNRPRSVEITGLARVAYLRGEYVNAFKLACDAAKRFNTAPAPSDTTSGTRYYRKLQASPRIIQILSVNKCNQKSATESFRSELYERGALCHDIMTDFDLKLAKGVVDSKMFYHISRYGDD